MYNRTIGERLKSERERRWVSLDEASNATRINKKYLLAIENNEFSEFSSHAQAIGFIRNYSHYLEIDSSNLIAIYKRDFESIKQTRKIRKINDEDLSKKKTSRLSQIKITSKKVWIASSVMFILIFILLGINVVRNAFAPPYFKISSPIELSVNGNETFSTSEKTIQIKGDTVGYTLIKVNEIPLVLSSGFSFETENLPTTDLETKFIITAESQLGVKSQAVLIVKRTDIAKKLEKHEISISTSESGAFIKATADGVVQYNDLVVKGVNVKTEANNVLEIETDKYSSITVTLNNKYYPLKGNHVKFEVNEDGNLIQTIL